MPYMVVYSDLHEQSAQEAAKKLTSSAGGRLEGANEGDSNVDSSCSSMATFRSRGGGARDAPSYPGGKSGARGSPPRPAAYARFDIAASHMQQPKHRKWLSDGAAQRYLTEAPGWMCRGMDMAPGGVNGGAACWPPRQSMCMSIWLLAPIICWGLTSDGNDAMLSMPSRSPSTESKSKVKLLAATTNTVSD